MTKICNGSDKYVTNGIYEYIHVIRLNAIDNIRIPRRSWDERLLSMIGRLMRETSWRKHKKQTSVNWLQNDRNQKKTAGFKSSNLMGELRPAKGISLSFNKTAGRAGRTNSTIVSKYQYSNPVNFIPLNILFHLCVSVKWSLNYSVLSSVQKSVFTLTSYNTIQ